MQASEKTLVRVKCDSKFDRTNVDCKLAEIASKNGQKNDSEEEGNSQYIEVIVDFHWITDSVYVQELLPISIYSMD